MNRIRPTKDEMHLTVLALEGVEGRVCQCCMQQEDPTAMDMAATAWRVIAPIVYQRAMEEFLDVLKSYDTIEDAERCFEDIREAKP